MQREMTLDEWVHRLPEIHAARREYVALRERVTAVERWWQMLLAACRVNTDLADHVFDVYGMAPWIIDPPDEDPIAEDAARYRWLRATNPAALAAIAYSVPAACQYGDVDAAIDAAMGQTT